MSSTRARDWGNSGRVVAAVAAAAATLLIGPTTDALAAGKPIVAATYAEKVSPTGADLKALVEPNGATTTYFFEYTPETTFEEQGFAGALRAPGSAEKALGTGNPNASEHIGGLKTATAYRFRIVAHNEFGTQQGNSRVLTTDESGVVFELPDNRGWELVSPVNKNGGQIQGFGGNFGGGVLQAASGGGAVTYSSATSFGADGSGAPGASQYVSTRSGGGWTTANVTPAAESGSYPESQTAGVPYQLFSDDLGDALFSNGRRCRTSATKQCPVANPPLPGSGAPAGFRNYYVRDSLSGSSKGLLDATDLSSLVLGAEDFELEFAGATPDLAHIVISTCAALTLDATEVAGSDGECNPAKQNLYEKSGSSLGLLNLKPGQATGAPGAVLAAQSRAISADGSRVYWTDSAETELYVRNGAETIAVDDDDEAGARFQTASADGSVAYYLRDKHLFRFLIGGGVAQDLTPGEDVQGVLGTSADGSYVYFQTAAGISLWHSGTTTAVALPGVAGNFPPTSGTARVSADGTHLVFVSSAESPTFDNNGFDEVYRYTAPAGATPGALLCVSCNPSGERAIGKSSLPGASPNGVGYNAPRAYKPRVLSADSDRVYFNSADAISLQDTNNAQDVYQWEASGSGNCAKASGCISLISSGRALGPSSFIDASADGSDVFFLTSGSLVQADPPGKTDVYDARVDGGFPEPPTPIPCFGDACQPLPPEPEDPNPSTTRPSKGNSPLVLPKPMCKRSQVRKKGKCVNKKKHKTKHHKKGGGSR